MIEKSPWAVDEFELWRAGMASFGAEAGGIARGYLIDRSDLMVFADLIAGMKRGDREAKLLVICCYRALHALHGKQCIFCQWRFSKRHQPRALVIFLPGANQDHAVESAVTVPICEKCRDARPDSDQLLREAMNVMWPTALVCHK